VNATIKVRARSIGFHNWPGATPGREYLADRHRHEFHVEVCAAVHHDDRDIEFHDLKDALADFMPRGELGAQSCEMMARTIIERLSDLWPGRILWCEVWEDGECGARVES
jgi:hypothetical protein